MIIRKEQPQDYEAIRRVNEEAFKGTVEADLIESIRRSDYYQPALSLVAEAEDGLIVGYIMFSEISLEAAGRSRFILALAPLAVLPAYQGTRVGSRLWKKESVYHAKKHIRPLLCLDMLIIIRDLGLFLLSSLPFRRHLMCLLNTLCC